MARSIWQKTITDEQGNIQEGVQITVNVQGGGLADISANQSGSVSKDNPFLTGVDGVAKFFAEPGFYEVTAFKNGETATFEWNNVGDNRLREDMAETDSSVIIGGVGIKKRAIQVATVAEAKAINAPIDTVIETQGYTSSGDGGANRYVVVAGGTGTEDGGSFIDMDNSNQLEGLFSSIVNVKQFGATGDINSDDTNAIDNAILYIENHRHDDAPQINGSRTIYSIYNGWTLYFPRGAYNYSGTGHSFQTQKSWKIKGDSPNSSLIRILSDVHLFRSEDSNPLISYLEFNSIKLQGGRGAYFCTKTDVGNVQYGKRIYNSCFWGYTSVAFGSLNFEDARLHVQQSVFEGGDTGTPVGLILPDEVAETDISGNTFSGNKYQIICRPNATRYTIGPNNFFFSTGISSRESDIWIIPSDINFRNGIGLQINGNRFSNENGNYDKIVLIADRDNSTPSHVFTHSTNKSNGYARGVHLENNNFSRRDDILLNKGVIYSYAYLLGGLVVRGGTIDVVPYILEFDPVVTDADIDAGQNFTNRYYPEAGTEPFNGGGVIALSNRKGAGLVVGHCVNRGYLEEISEYDSALTNFTNLLPNNSTSGLSKGNVTLTQTTDAEGGINAAVAEFTQSGGVIFLNSQIDLTSLKPGVPCFIEMDVKKHSSNSLDFVQLDVRISSNNATYYIPLTDYWNRVRIPVSWADDYSASGILQFTIEADRSFVNGTKTNFQLGRRAIYHANGFVDYEKVRT